MKHTASPTCQCSRCFTDACAVPRRREVEERAKGAVMNERLKLQIDYDGSGWDDMGYEAANLSEAMDAIGRLRGEGGSEQCLAGYRVLDPSGGVVLILAPINLRITGARFKSSGLDPDSSTV